MPQIMNLKSGKNKKIHTSITRKHQEKIKIYSCRDLLALQSHISIYFFHFIINEKVR